LASCCFINDGKGNFKKMALPDELQLAPVMSFVSLNNNQSPAFLAAGNFYGVTPYEGRYDALQPTIISFDKTKETFNSQMALRDFDGEVRDMEWIRSADQNDVLIIARNNSELTFLKQVQ
jgi:enediyne biosynthesis protein E4